MSNALMSNALKSALKRFVRGGVATAAATAIPMFSIQVSGIDELNPFLVKLAIVLGLGFISGFIQAVDKYLRFEE